MSKDAPDILAQAIALRDAAAKRVKELDVFIKTFMTIDAGGSRICRATTTQRAYPGRALDDTASAVVAILRAHGAPMQTRDLVAMVEARGVPIDGKNKIATLSARLSRAPQLVNTRPYGWWLRDPELAQNPHSATPVTGGTQNSAKG